MSDRRKKLVVGSFERITTIFSQENDNVLLALGNMRACFLAEKIGNRTRLSGFGLTGIDVRFSAADDPDLEGDIGVIEALDDPELKKPPMFKVILLNDDYTPMEFVVHILESFFGMDREKATQIMLVVHSEGSAVVGIYPRDIAETKSEKVNAYSQENNHPLVSTVEITD